MIVADSAADTVAVDGVGGPVDDRVLRAAETTAASSNAVVGSASGLAEAAVIELGVANEQRKTNAKPSDPIALMEHEGSCAASPPRPQEPSGTKRAGASYSAFRDAKIGRHEVLHRSSMHPNVRLHENLKVRKAAPRVEP